MRQRSPQSSDVKLFGFQPSPTSSDARIASLLGSAAARLWQPHIHIEDALEIRSFWEEAARLRRVDAVSAARLPHPLRQFYPVSCRGIVVPQPIEPHGLHRSYNTDRKQSRAKAALTQRSGPPTPGPFGDATELYRTAKLLSCGGLAGALSRTLTAPIDRLKFLMQVHTESHLTVRQGLAMMAKEGSLKAYFRGNGTNVAKNIPETAMKLTCNDRIKAKIVKDGHNITLGERLVVGAASGAFAQAVIYPLEVIQTRLAATHGVYNGMLDVIQSIWHKEGLKAFYRGSAPCLLGILPYAGLDITSFELMKEWLQEKYDGLPPAYCLLACGMLSSSGAQTVAYPFGFIRTRLQMDGLSASPYKGMLDCLRQVLQQEGWRGLYKGFGMSLAKIAPAAGISWFIFEESKALLEC